MRRFPFVLLGSLLSVTAAFASQSQSPPPAQTATPTPTPAQPTPPPGATTAGGRGGMVSGAVVVERQTNSIGGQRSGGPSERMAVTTFIAPSGPTSWQNVKLDVKISDSLNTETQHSKTMTMLCLDGNSGQVRSTGGDGLINIDARPAIRPDGRIYLQLILEYRPDFSGQSPAPAQATTGAARPVGGFSESLNLLIPDGKPIVASQSADPRSDRKVTVEVTATVVK